MIENKNKDRDDEKKITTRAEDYSKWYLDVIEAAQLAEHSLVRGCMVIKPNGYSLWEKVQGELDKQFKKSGVRNVYFPMFIPSKLLEKEAEHVEGFAPEVAIVTKAGGKDLEEPLVIRPTSETIMYEAFSRWIDSYRDLPLLVNQWANVVRWEMRTRLFLRTTEFLWQEGHTVHSTEKEADERARMMLDVYQNFARDFLAICVIPGQKSESEKFAGALYTYTIEAMMQDGKALQLATSHNLGDNFAKAFDVKFLDEKNDWQYAWQTSWGISTRCIGGLIMSHSDDTGLVLPPKMAANKIVIIPIYKGENKKEVLLFAEKIKNDLPDELGVILDDRDSLRPGEKYFQWEKQGIPLRLEIGQKDMDTGSVMLVRRDSKEKISVSIEGLSVSIKEILEKMQNDLYQKSVERLEKNTVTVFNLDDFKKEIEDNKFVLADWSFDQETEKKLKEEMAVTVRCIPFEQPKEIGNCIFTNKPAIKRVLFGRSY